MSKTLSRRDFLHMAAIAGVGATVAACTPTTVIVKETSIVKETTIVEATAAPGKDVTGELRILIGKGAPIEPTNELLTATVQGKYPKIAVKFEYMPATDYTEKVYTSAAAGNLADVFFSADLFVVPFAKNGVSLDLKPYATADPDVNLDDVFPSMLGLGVFDNKIQMLPSGLDVVTLYYNKTLFEKAGAEIPTDKWTWADFVTNAKKITALEKNDAGVPKYWGMGTATWNWWATVYPWIVGYGGSILGEGKSTWSDEKTVAGLTAYTDMWTKDNVIQPLGVDVGGDAFQLGLAGIYCHIQALRTSIRTAVADKFEWDVQLMPLMPDGKHRTGMGTWGMSANAKGKDLDAAYQYIKGLILPSVQRILAQKEIAVPLLKSVANDPSWMEGLQTPPKNFIAFVKSADDAILPVMDYPADCGSFYAGEVAKSYQGALEAVIRGTKDSKTAFTEVDATIQTCLDTNK